MARRWVLLCERHRCGVRARRANRRGFDAARAGRLAGVAVALGACGDEPAPRQGQAQTQTALTSTDPARLANAYPADGCKVQIVFASRAGRELNIRFKANYAADVSPNHFHIYWSTYTAQQVSSDAAPRFGVKQGAVGGNSGQSVHDGGRRFGADAREGP